MSNKPATSPNLRRTLFDDMKISASHLLRRGTITKDPAGYPFTEERAYKYTVYHGGAWWLMACLAFVLLTLCALLAGLTLGVCGLDMASLKMRSITGTAKEKQQALIVARLKRHATWMLCSLIICSVACSEYFPFLIQSLFAARNEWLSVLVSTLLLAVFAEMIPQWLIPQRAITWGYYCWPFIWACMWLTAIISYPLAWILDTLGRKGADEFGIFTNEQLAIMIKYHERSKKHGGMLGHDTVRVVLGALSNEGRRIGCDISRIPDSSCGSDIDLEKGDVAVTQGMIVKWSAVKIVNINEQVDRAFIQKVKSWSYSRIPVIGESQSENNKNATETSDWKGKEVFGFLHVKNLVGLEFKSKNDLETKILVKDLPLYPLPIIREDMSVYELLNMFQLGMSRMAIVIPTTPLSNPSMVSSASRPTLWTATQRTNARIVSRMKEIKGLKAHEKWAADYLAAAQTNIQNSVHGRRRVHGISSPKPIGIITFEDIIDTLLQKTSRDEKDFFDRENGSPRTKTRKPGDFQSVSSIHSSRKKNKISSAEKKPQPQYGTLRKRKVTKLDTIAGVDGVDDRSFGDVDVPLKISKVRNNNEDSSSYTQNTRGGFHGTNESTSFDHTMVMTAEHIAELGNISSSDCPENPYSLVKAASLPSRKGKNAILPQVVGPLSMWRHVSASPRLPHLRRVTPLSRQSYSGYEKMGEGTGNEELVMPKHLTQKKIVKHNSGAGMGFDMNDTIKYAQEHAHENSGDTNSLNSWYGDITDFEGCTTQISDTDPVLITSDKVKIDISAENENQGISQEPPAEIHLFHTPEAYKRKVIVAKPYDGFPPELLDQKNENNSVKYATRTMPRMTGSLALDVLHERNDSETRSREKSFHDDRALLPSQRRALNEGAILGGTRNSSLWF